MPGLISFIRQSFPGKPVFTDVNVPDLEGKVTIVTGANTGLGKEIAQILYAKHAKVYMMARSEDKTKVAMQSIEKAVSSSRGEMVFIPLDLSDLSTIKTSTEKFLQKESQLHYLFNNAGVAYPEKGSHTKQGYELQLGINCIGTFALTKLLTPTLISSARASKPALSTARIIWVSSSAAESITTENYMENLTEIGKRGSFEQYCISKLGNYLHAAEFTSRYKDDGVLAIPLNPGNLDSELWRTSGSMMKWILRKTLLYPPVYGAYTALFAAFTSQTEIEKAGCFVAPWGRMWTVSKEMIDASRSVDEGGSGIAKQFWDWTEEQVNRNL